MSLDTNRRMFYEEEEAPSPEYAKIRRRRLVCRQLITPTERCEAPIEFLEDLARDICDTYKAPIPGNFQSLVGYLIFSAIGDVFAQFLQKVRHEAKLHKEEEDNARRE